MEMNNWIRKTCEAMQISISQEEVQAVGQLHQMIMAGMPEVNRLELGALDPVLTYSAKGSEQR